MKSIFKLTAVGVAVALSGCSWLQSDKVDYRTTVKVPTLEIPPDLTQLSKETRYTMVDGAVSASGSQAATGAAVVAQPAIAAAVLDDMRIERAGTQRWLVVKRPANALWTPLKDFWAENGFALVMDQPNVGIMETDWAENRAKVPQDIIRTYLGKLLDSVYDSGERDRYRTRLETNAAGETEIYITHRGMVEVLVKDGSGSVWQPRESDPELEAEFLRKLMVKLGKTPAQAQATVAQADAATPPRVANVTTTNGQPTVAIAEAFDRAWRRVGLALDRTGFTVEDRDRKQGIYFVRYVAPNPDKKDPGFFGRLFSSEAKPNEAAKFQILVKGAGDSTIVSVLDAKGTPDSSPSAQKIVQVIADDIK